MSQRLTVVTIGPNSWERKMRRSAEMVYFRGITLDKIRRVLDVTPGGSVLIEFLDGGTKYIPRSKALRIGLEC